MPKFMIHGSYTAEGAKGLAREGEAAEKLLSRKLSRGLAGSWNRCTSPLAPMMSS